MASSQAAAAPLRCHAAFYFPYIGHTADLRQCVATHNAGGSPHTAKYRPGRITTYLAFSEKPKATAFERYLKSHSGIAFARNRL
jgi:putative endonuclease